jgi:spermidine/putrescine-binding protein
MIKKILLLSAGLTGLFFSTQGLTEQTKPIPENRKSMNAKQAIFDEKHKRYLEKEAQKEELQKKVWTKEMDSKVPKDSYEAFEQKRNRHQVLQEQLTKDDEIENKIESNANAIKKAIEEREMTTTPKTRKPL